MGNWPYIYPLGCLQGGWGEHSSGCNFYTVWSVASRGCLGASTGRTRKRLKDESKIVPRSFHVRHTTVFLFRNRHRSLSHTCFHITSKTQLCRISCTRLPRYPFPSDERTPSTSSRILPQSQGQNLALTVFCVPYSLDSSQFKNNHFAEL